MKALYIAFLLCLFGMSAQAQQDPHFTMYMFNKQVINPGYVGSRGTLSLTGLGRQQWVGINKAPQTLNLGFHAPWKPFSSTPSENIAYGAYIFGDNLGLTSTNGVYGQYAYIIKTSETTRLSLGIQGGFVNYLNRLTDSKPLDGGDPLLQSDLKSALLPNVGFGAYWYGKNFYAGFSIPHLIQNKFDKDLLPTVGTLVARQYRHYFAMGGYVISLEALPNIKLQPNLILKYVVPQSLDGGKIGAPFDFDINVSAIIYDRVILGLSYRMDDSFDALIQFQALRNLRVGYAYDFTVSSLGRHNSGSHELMLGIDFGARVKSFNDPVLLSYH